MAAVRHIRIQHFRGFQSWETTLRDHAVIVGEPGAGKSDLIEALIRVLDPDSLRGRQGSELDLYDLDTGRQAFVELVIGDLSEDAKAAMFSQLELWDKVAEELVTRAPAGFTPDPARHERVVRFAYRLAVDDGSASEFVYFPRDAAGDGSGAPRVRSAIRSLVPFYWQRGISTKPLDLGGRGELRGLIDQQTGQEFQLAVDAFIQSVEAAAEAFSSQERVASALEAIFESLRSVRRFDPTTPASDLLRFLPDGGSPSGLLRSLAAAVTIDNGPEYFPASRHGSTLLASLRAGALRAAALATENAVVAIDDFGGGFDPLFARHMVRAIKNSVGQAIVATHSPQVVAGFSTEQVVRLHWRGAERVATRGPSGAAKPERIAIRYLTASLLEAMNASAVIVLEGHHDRLGYAALADRATVAGLLESMEGAGVVLVDADGNGNVATVSAAARQLGIFTVAVLDNDGGVDASADGIVQACVAAADAVVRLPARTAVEAVLLAGVPDGELVRVFSELALALGDLKLEPGWEALTGDPLRRQLVRALKSGGSVHAAYVAELSSDNLPQQAIDVLRQARAAAVTRATGLIEL